MKNNIIIKGFAALMTTGMLIGCSSDYLQVDPVTAVSSATVQNTPEGAQAALNGLCGAMYIPYGDFEANLQPNGEATIMAFYGDVMGQDYYSRLWAYRAPFVFTMDRFRQNDSWLSTIPWSYCYNLISQANTILAGIDGITREKEKMMFIKAEALTIRAHAYVRLLQLYGPRWADSREGEEMTVVIRTEPGTQDAPLSSMNDVLKLIYSDLDTAIALFESNSNNRSYIWEPDEDVARGVYARAALLKNDYATAEKMAHDSRKNNRYPIMSAEEYKGGFAEPNGEWMWGNEPELERTAYWSNGAWYACNGAYVDWNQGVGAINYELYRQMPVTDIRRDLFFTPDKLSGGTLSQAAFWNKSIVNPSTMSLAYNVNMKNQYRNFGQSVIPNGDQAKWARPYYSRMQGTPECDVFFGSQYKFWGLDAYGTDGWPFMRGAEMLLTEAEAACHNGNYSTAQALLMELNAKRNPQYSCNKTGDALLEEVKLQRRFELWGEGFNFFDLKRWNVALVRNPWIEGDMSSNNIPRANQINFTPDMQSGWRWIIPRMETQYNNKIDQTLLQ